MCRTLPNLLSNSVNDAICFVIVTLFRFFFATWELPSAHKRSRVRSSWLAAVLYENGLFFTSLFFNAWWPPWKEKERQQLGKNLPPTTLSRFVTSM